MVYKFTTNIKGINIVLYFVTYSDLYKSEKTIIIYSKLVFLILCMLDKYLNKKCMKNLEIKIFLTPFKKQLLSDNKILGPFEVNTGMSTIGCNSNTLITIYRQEEWFKVFIHELFHALNLDFSSMNIDNSISQLHNFFELDSEYLLFETYTELWARIFNVVIVNFLKSSSYTQFVIYFNRSLNLERLYSLQQASIIFHRIINNKNYKENTNVLCYYVFTSILFYDYLKFFEWCENNNTSLFDFKKTKKNLLSFTKLLIEESNNKQYLDSLLSIKQSIDMAPPVSLRMTIIDHDL